MNEERCRKCGHLWASYDPCCDSPDLPDRILTPQDGRQMEINSLKEENEQLKSQLRTIHINADPGYCEIVHLTSEWIKKTRELLK